MVRRRGVARARAAQDFHDRGPRMLLVRKTMRHWSLIRAVKPLVSSSSIRIRTQGRRGSEQWTLRRQGAGCAGVPHRRTIPLGGAPLRLQGSRKGGMHAGARPGPEGDPAASAGSAPPRSWPRTGRTPAPAWRCPPSPSWGTWAQRLLGGQCPLRTMRVIFSRTGLTDDEAINCGPGHSPARRAGPGAHLRLGAPAGGARGAAGSNPWRETCALSH